MTTDHNVIFPGDTFPCYCRAQTDHDISESDYDPIVLLLVERMQYVEKALGKIHPSRGCIGCDICTLRTLLEGYGEGKTDEIICLVTDLIPDEPSSRQDDNPDA
jgi:hypothetical protein